MNKLHVRLGVFGATPITILRDPHVTLNPLKVFIAISSFQGTQESCVPSQDQIAERAGIQVRHARGAIQKLIWGGWLEKRHRGRGLTDKYWTTAKLEAVEAGLMSDRTESIQSGDSKTGQRVSSLDRTETVRRDRTESVRSSEEKDQIERPNRKSKAEKIVFVEPDPDRPLTGVRMTQAEYDPLVQQHGESVVRRAIEKLAAYKSAKSKVYASDAGALRTWGLRAAYEEVKREAELGVHLGGNGNGTHHRKTCPECGEEYGGSGSLPCDACARKIKMESRENGVLAGLKVIRASQLLEKSAAGVEARERNGGNGSHE